MNISDAQNIALYDQDERVRATVDADPYACAVVEVLARHFPDLRLDGFAGHVRKWIYIQQRTSGPLEVILDSPVRANWRLVPHGNGRRGLRVGCWRPQPTDTDLDRERVINEALTRLDTLIPSAGSGEDGTATT